MIDETEKPDDVEETAAAEVEESETQSTESVTDEAAEAPAEEPVAEADETPDEEPVAEADEEPVAEAEETPDEEPAKPAASKQPEAPAKPRTVKPAPTEGDVQLVRAQARYVRTSARKARLVCDHIRGKSVEEARAILAHANRQVAEDWSKLLESAVANAEHNHELIGEDLKIHAVYADEGPTLKRFRPRAMGRATQIRKRTSHLSIALTPKEQ